jgi:hypothetical protein
MSSPEEWEPVRRWVIRILTGLLFVAFSVDLASAVTGKAGGALIEGKLVDLACYLTLDAADARRTRCAVGCEKAGMPLGVLKKGSREVYSLLAPSPALAEYAHQPVAVTGTVYGYVIAPVSFEVFRDGRWEPLESPYRKDGYWGQACPDHIASENEATPR